MKTLLTMCICCFALIGKAQSSLFAFAQNNKVNHCKTLAKSIDCYVRIRIDNQQHVKFVNEQFDLATNQLTINLFETSKSAYPAGFPEKADLVKIKATNDNCVVTVQEADRIKGLTTHLLQAKKYSSQWMQTHYKDYDANLFKDAPGVRQRLKMVIENDWNKAAFRLHTIPEVRFVDWEKQLIGVECGSRKLYDNVHQRKDFMTYIAVYHFEKKEIIKVLVKSTGIFLE